MSEYWGAKCLDCNVYSDSWFNHGPEKVKALILLYPNIKILRDCLEIEIDVTINEAVEHPLPFMRKHDGHKLQIVSEYGNTYPSGT